MKRTCNGCRAFNFDKYCDLGYKVELIHFQHSIINAKPLENCPKPKTTKEYVELYFKDR